MNAQRIETSAMGDLMPELSTRIYTAVDPFITLGMNDTLDGGHVLPGFTLRISELFGSLAKV